MLFDNLYTFFIIQYFTLLHISLPTTVVVIFKMVGFKKADQKKA